MCAVKTLLRKIPIYGDLALASKDKLREAFKDLIFSTVFSLFPLWFFPMLAMLVLTDPTPIQAAIWQSVGNGDMFLFSSALLGPVVYAITKKYSEPSEPETEGGRAKVFPWKRRYEFPHGEALTIASIAVCLLSALCYAAIKSADTYDFSQHINRYNLAWFSAILYIFTLSCAYCVSVYRLALEGVAINMQKGDRDLARQWDANK